MEVFSPSERGSKGTNVDRIIQNNLSMTPSQSMKSLGNFPQTCTVGALQSRLPSKGTFAQWEAKQLLSPKISSRFSTPAYPTGDFKPPTNYQQTKLRQTDIGDYEREKSNQVKQTMEGHKRSDQ
jgi:hypothetical protein